LTNPNTGAVLQPFFVSISTPVGHFPFPPLQVGTSPLAADIVERMKATISALLLDSAMHSNQKTQRPTQHEFINQLEHGTERAA
jgi:hypothetical protein